MSVTLSPRLAVNISGDVETFPFGETTSATSIFNQLNKDSTSNNKPITVMVSCGGVSEVTASFVTEQE